jgi:hypothetical protein
VGAVTMVATLAAGPAYAALGGAVFWGMAAMAGLALALRPLERAGA